MLIKKKILTKTLSWLLVLLTAFNPMLVGLIWANDELGETEFFVIQDLSLESSDLLVKDEKADESFNSEENQLQLDTGKAQSSTEAETKANINIDNIPGSISYSDGQCGAPLIETSCLKGIDSHQDNLANLEQVASSSATSGESQVMGDNILLKTGAASASAEVKNTLNLNMAVFGDDQEVSRSSTQSAELAGGGELEGEVANSSEPDNKKLFSQDIVLTNQNEASVSSQTVSLANSGNNQIQSSGQIKLDSGESTAYANVFNLLNANIVASYFDLFLFDILSQQTGNIDLNQLWNSINVPVDDVEVSDGQANLSIFNKNVAHLFNKVEVNALSGGNQVKADNDVVVNTGGATAMANVLNFVNINIMGSKFVFGVINIFSDKFGDIILPAPNKFSNQAETDSVYQAEALFSNQNIGEVNNRVAVSADSGHNSVTSPSTESETITGEAVSKANSWLWLNTNIVFNDWLFLNVNRLGDWSGKIMGWSSPEAVEEARQEQIVLAQAADQPSFSEEKNYSSEYPSSEINNHNQAYISNQIEVTAITGQNEIESSQEIKLNTGKATAMANLFEFVNLNIVGGSWFFGVINILGDWSGNIIFAYPDVSVLIHNGSGKVKPGEITSYTLDYQNNGYDRAYDVNLELQLPTGIKVIDQASDFPFTCQDNFCTWHIDQLAVKENGTIKVFVQVDPDFSFEDPPSILQTFIRPALASDGCLEKEIITTAFINTINSESDLHNNQATVKTLIYTEDKIEEADDDKNENNSQNEEGTSELEITAKNNVGEYVYPGDIASFEIEVYNTGSGRIENTVLVQELFNSIPDLGFGTAQFNIGVLEPKEGVLIKFGLQLLDDDVLEAGHYYTIAQATGTSSDGQELSSNQARTDFDIRLKQILSLLAIKAAPKKEETVLGLIDENNKQCPAPEKELLPYVLLFLTSSFWILDRLKRLRLKHEN